MRLLSLAIDETSPVRPPVANEWIIINWSAQLYHFSRPGASELDWDAMPISVYIDNNVWDFLFDRKMDLAAELPKKEFCICSTREAEFEIPPMPPEKKAFAEETIARCEIRTDAFFGFAEAGLPSGDHRVAGFNQGRWISAEEMAFIEQQRTAIKNRMRPSRLMKARPICR
jgi:hypothetical protein